MTDSPVPLEGPYEERSPFSPAGDAALPERVIPVAGELPGYRLGASISPDRRFPTVRAAVEYCVAHDART